MQQEPAEPEVVDGGIPASGLVAHTLISRFADHLPYYRQEAINVWSVVHTPHSTLAAWAGAGSAALEPLYEAHKRFVLAAGVLHADETPIALLDPDKGKTKKAYVWAYARSLLEGPPGVIYDFCPGRGAQYPKAFLGGKGPPYAEPAWRGTLVPGDDPRVRARSDPGALAPRQAPPRYARRGQRAQRRTLRLPLRAQDRGSDRVLRGVRCAGRGRAPRPVHHARVEHRRDHPTPERIGVPTRKEQPWISIAVPALVDERTVKRDYR